MSARETIRELTAQADERTAENLRSTDAGYRDALEQARRARVARRAADPQAIEDGWTQQRISEVLEVSRGRVAQMVVRDA